MTASISTRICPQCGAAYDSDTRFTDWCPGCEWNLGSEPAVGRRAARRRSRERARADGLHRQLAVRAPAGRRRGPGELLALVLASLVHLGTLAVGVGSVWLLLSGNVLFIVVGVAGLGVAYLLRPRFGGHRVDHEAVLSRELAPELYALTDRIAAELGVRRPARIRVQPGYRTAYARLGAGREGELTVGMSIWTVLTPQERIALLARELAHGRTGDPRRGLWLRLALDTLDAWYGLLVPGSGDELMSDQVRNAGRYDVMTGAGIMMQMNATAQKSMFDWLANRLLLICSLPVRLARWTLQRLVLSGSWRAEYRADDLAARVGSSAALRALLDLLFLHESATAYLFKQRALVGHARTVRPDDLAEALWSGLAEYLDSLPDIERERRRRLAVRRASAVDAWHPPTHLRVRLQAERAEQPPALPADTVDWTAIHAELEDSRWRTAILVLGI